jgi:hypothetical protein
MIGGRPEKGVKTFVNASAVGGGWGREEVVNAAFTVEI